MKEQFHPPGFARRFLEWFCPEYLFEGIEGDLIEEFQRNVKLRGVFTAKVKFLLGVLKFFRPGILLRNRFRTDLTHILMLKSFFVISWRYLRKHKVFATINVLGLAVGMAVAMLIYHYVSYETSFDSFHEGADDTYRVTTQWNKSDGDKRATSIVWSGQGVKDYFPEVRDFAYFTPVESFTGFNSVSYKDKQVQEQGIFLADAGFLRMFSFEMLKGDRTSALSKPNSIVITKSIEEKYFGSEDAIGKTLIVDTHENLSEHDFIVTGVIQDPPENSHIDFDFLISFNVIPRELHNGSTYWHWDYTYVYIQLYENADADVLEKKMSKRRVDEFGKDMQYYSDVIDFKLQSIRDIHLYSSLKGEVLVNGDGRGVTFLAIVGLCILICAYINYINLSTIKAVERKTEIGIRKVIGSTRSQLIFQLLVESFVINVAAVVCAVMIYTLSIPLLEQVFNVSWPVAQILEVTQLLLAAIALFISGVILSALYPAFVLTSFRPAQVLAGKGSMLPLGHGPSLRQSLIVLQFVFCIVFTVATYAMYRQLSHMKHHDLGMDVTQVVAIRENGFQKYSAFENFRNSLNDPNIRAIGSSSAAPGDEITQLSLKPKVVVEGKPGEAVEMKIMLVDESYFTTLGISFAAGRNFDRAIRTDDESVIINEAAAKALGLTTSDAHGQSIANLAAKSLPVIGVVKDFHQRSLKVQVDPMIFMPIWTNEYGWNKKYYFARLGGSSFEDYRATLQHMETVWKRVNPDRPFQYFFLDDYFGHQYKADSAFSSLFMFFSGMAIFIACLGLFGLVAFTTLQRTKEIGVRKVFGASVNNILTLLSKDFMKLILVAVVMSVPLLAWGLDLWLEAYAFRIPVSVGLFAIPIVIICTLALITIIARSFNVATRNPVDSLRYE